MKTMRQFCSFCLVIMLICLSPLQLFAESEVMSTEAPFVEMPINAEQNTEGNSSESISNSENISISEDPVMVEDEISIDEDPVDFEPMPIGDEDESIYKRTIEVNLESTKQIDETSEKVLDALYKDKYELKDTESYISLKMEGNLPETVSIIGKYTKIEGNTEEENPQYLLQLDFINADGSAYIPNTDIKFIIEDYNISNLSDNTDLLIYVYGEAETKDAIFMETDDSIQVDVLKATDADIIYPYESIDDEDIYFIGDDNEIKINKEKEKVSFKKYIHSSSISILVSKINTGNLSSEGDNIFTNDDGVITLPTPSNEEDIPIIDNETELTTETVSLVEGTEANIESQTETVPIIEDINSSIENIEEGNIEIQSETIPVIEDITQKELVSSDINNEETLPFEILQEDSYIDGNIINETEKQSENSDEIVIMTEEQSEVNSDIILETEELDITTNILKDGEEEGENTYNVEIEGTIPDDVELVTNPVAETDIDPIEDEKILLGINIELQYKEDSVNYNETNNKYELENPVNVIITSDSIEDALLDDRVLNLWHITGEGAEQVENVQFIDDSVEFVADGFSTYVITKHIDSIEWGDYTYNIEGKDEVTISDIFEALRITDITSFNIKDMECSEDDLFEIVHEDSDWILTDIVEFEDSVILSLILQTDQVVTITLINQEEIETEAITEEETEAEIDALCKIVIDDIPYYFDLLQDAVNFIDRDVISDEGVIELLKDYEMTENDIVTIPNGVKVSIITSEDLETLVTITRGSDVTEESLFNNAGTLIFNNIIIDGEQVETDVPLISSTHKLEIGQGTTIKRCINTENGGVIFASGNITINNATFNNNSAKNGGVIYCEDECKIEIQGNTKFQNNVATTEDGGAIYILKGEVISSGSTTFSNNTALSGFGGAVYSDSAILTVNDSTKFISNKAINGGAVYINQSSIITGEELEVFPEFSQNVVTENGGAIYVNSGIATLEGVTFTNNTATSGYGGGIYTNTGTVSLKDGLITENSAINGSAVYIASNSGTFNGVEIKENTTTDGGAIGFNAISSRLYFSGDVKIYDNTKNVYLDKDSDLIINADSLGENAEIGVYVVGTKTENIFKNRTIPGAKFATYTIADNIETAFTNDRFENLSATVDSTTQKVLWTQPIQVEVHELSSFATQMPPIAKGSTKYDQPYTPLFASIDVSVLAEKMYPLYMKSLSSTVSYSCAFVSDAQSYNDLITNIEWNTTTGEWDAILWNNNHVSLSGKKLALYYSDAVFLSIENNTSLPLQVSDLIVLNKSVKTTATDVGFGLLFAVNGAIQDVFDPVKDTDLYIDSGKIIRIMLSGSYNQNYTFTGNFIGTFTDNVRVKRTGENESSYTPTEASTGFTFTKRLPNVKNGVYTIAFGDERFICKVKDANNEEQRFSKISDAIDFIVTNTLTTASIEMISDYLLPNDDIIVIPEGYNITLKTAIDGTFKYPGTSELRRANISRDSENKNSFITGSYNASTTITSLTIQNINFDGKSIRGNSDGGAVFTKSIKLTIENCDFKNFISGNGGALYIEFEGNATYDYANASSLSVTNAIFTNCHSDSTKNRQGGGAIWVNAYTFNMSGCQFNTCVSYDQGGAVFDRIDYLYGDVYKNGTTSTVSNCSFLNCQAKAAGGLELDSFHNTVTGCTFNNCQAIVRNGGALNMFIQTETDNDMNNKEECDFLVENCSFTDCNSVQNGGGLRSLAKRTTVRNCTFNNTNSTLVGGAIGANNTNAVELNIYGVKITNCSGSKGGGIYTSAKTVVFDTYEEAGVDDDGEPTIIVKKNEISNCMSTSIGGGLCVENADAEASLTGNRLEITNCISLNMGGGIYISANTMHLENSKINGNKATASGGGIAFNKASNSNLELYYSEVKQNTSSIYGGGVYTKAPLKLKSTHIELNRLTINDLEKAAGAYIDNKAFIVGIADSSDDSTIKNNRVSSGALSNLRLWESSGSNNSASVYVLGHLTGEIGVVNAKNVGTKFGSMNASGYLGFSDDAPVIKSDTNAEVWGTISRTDNTGKILIWRGPPICKITDEGGTLLYFKINASDKALYPATFGHLDNGTTGADNDGAFSILKNTKANLKMYYADGTRYGDDPDEYIFCVKMLADYTVTSYVTSNKANTWQKIILTTAGSSEEESDGYYYRGRGTRATLTRGSSVGANAMITFKVNGEVKDIILDGGSTNGVSTTVDGCILFMKDNANANVLLGNNLLIQNGITSGNGAGMAINTGTVTIDGATFKNVQAKNGGALYINSGKTITLTDGTIDGGTATTAGGNGGGVCVNNGTFTMEAGEIKNCSAVTGAGIFVANNKTVNIFGGEIKKNTATSKGGGIAVGGSGSKIYFAGDPIVVDNKLNTTSCNVELDVDNAGVINTKNGGLINGADIGVYVTGKENTNSNYDKHGKENLSFGTFTANDDTTTFYCFINDRNGLKGGLKVGQNTANDKKIYWVKIFSLKVSKTVLKSDQDPSTNETFDFQVTLTGESDNNPDFTAGMVNGTFGDMKFVGNGTTKAVAKFTLHSGESITAENLDAGFNYEVKEVLKSSQKKKYTTIPGVTQTGYIGENATIEDTTRDRYTSIVEFENILPICKITNESGTILYREYKKDANSDTVLIPAVYMTLEEAVTANLGTLYSTNNSNDEYDLTNGLYIKMLIDDYKLSSSLNIVADEKVILTTAGKKDKTFAYRGSNNTAQVTRESKEETPFVDSMFKVYGDLTLNNIILDGNKENVTALSNGGIIFDSGTVLIEENTILRNSNIGLVTATEDLYNGGAVFVVATKTLKMTGGSINSNGCNGNGAGICLENGAILELSGAVDFGGKGTNVAGYIVNNTGNYKTKAIVGKTNGGKEYTKARQDIYIPESEEEQNLIDIKGNLTGVAGSIWVWAEDENHYAMMKPFAKTDTTINTVTYEIFRNAQTDDLTYCGEDGYITGSAGENETYIYWSGGSDISFIKIDPFGESQEGAVFTLYTDIDCTNSYKKSGTDVTATSADGTATYKNSKGETLDKGVVYFSKISAGTYYMKETTVPEGYVNSVKVDEDNQPVENIYIVLIGKSVLEKLDTDILDQLTNDDIIAQTGTGTTALDYAIFQIDTENKKAVNVPNIAKYGIMNISTSDKKVVFRKTDKNDDPLESAKFDIFRYDRSVVVEDKESKDSGVIWTGMLTFGKYYLHEKVVPSGYNALSTNDNWIEVTVDNTGLHDLNFLTVAPE